MTEIKQITQGDNAGWFKALNDDLTEIAKRTDTSFSEYTVLGIKGWSVSCSFYIYNFNSLGVRIMSVNIVGTSKTASYKNGDLESPAIAKTSSPIPWREVVAADWGDANIHLITFDANKSQVLLHTLGNHIDLGGSFAARSAWIEPIS